MSKRPEFTIAQVTERFDVSRSTLRRGLSDGRFPDARKDESGRWVIPVENVLQAGFIARKTWFNDPAHEPGSTVIHEQDEQAHIGLHANNNAVLSELEQTKDELARERAQAEKLAALLEAEREHVNSLRMALRMIEANGTAPSQVEATAEPVQEASRAPMAPVNEKPHQGPGFFSRLFRRR